MAKPRVHELAAELGVSSKDALMTLKAMGEFVKGPSSSLQPAVVRKLRQAIKEKLDLPDIVLPLSRRDEEHSSDFASRVRRSVIARSELNWNRYDFTVDEQRSWTSAGIPPNKAHVAAMCRDTMGRSPSRALSLAPENLRSKVSGETVVRALTAGSNTVDVQARLAASRNVGTTGISRTLETLVNESMPISVPGVGDARKALDELQWTPKSVPQIAGLHRRAIEVSTPLLAAHVQLREQVEILRERGEVRPLLASYGRIHGVFHTDEWMHALLDGIELDAQTYRDALSSSQLIAAAAISRKFFFVASPPSEEAFAALMHEVDDLIDTTGYALIAGDPDLDSPERVLAWVRAGDTIRSTVRSKQSMMNGLPEGSGAASRVDEWSVGQRDGLPSSALLVRLITALDRDLAGARPGVDRTASGNETQPSGNTGSVDDHDVVVVYRGAGEGNGVERTASERRRPGHRWVVRGHYRRQWYRSEQQHKTIWIGPHEAGPAEAPLIVREHVRVVRDQR